METNFLKIDFKRAATIHIYIALSSSPTAFLNLIPFQIDREASGCHQPSSQINKLNWGF